MEERERSALAERYTKLEITLENLLKQREEIEKRIEEIEETINAIKELKAEDETIFSIGSNIFGFGKLNKEKFLVNVGANIGIEMDKENAIASLNKTKNSLNKVLEEIDVSLNKIVEEQEKILSQLSKK